MQRNSEEDYQCNTCGQKFIGKNAKLFLNHHTKTHKTKLQICDNCGEIFKFETLLLEHRISFHNDEKEVFLENPSTISNLPIEFSNSSQPIEDFTDTKVKENLKVQNIQKSLSKKQFRCDQCKRVLTSSKRLQNHLTKLHKVQSKEDFIRCEKCGEEFENRSLFKKHMKIYHIIVFSSDDKLKGQMDVKKDLTMTHESNDVQSKKSDSLEPKTLCNKCQVDLKSKRKFIKHMASNHGTKDSYDCSNCDRTFKTFFRLEYHLNAIHKGMKYKCQHCNKILKYQDSLKRHIDIVHKQKPLEDFKFQCITCQKGFLTKRQVETHMMCVHNGEKNFECGKCGKCFAGLSSLKRHVELIHKRIKKHKCNICAKHFGEMRQLKKHIRNVHSVE